MDTRVPYTTLFRSEVTMSMTSRYFAPLGRRTRSHGGLGPTSGIVLEALGLIPSSTARVPCGLTILLPEAGRGAEPLLRSEEHTSELQSLMRISYAVFCLKKKTKPHDKITNPT